MKVAKQAIICFITLGILLGLSSCVPSASSNGSGGRLSCEQIFDRALQNGVPYTEALGDYTQCKIDRGETI